MIDTAVWDFLNWDVRFTRDSNPARSLAWLACSTDQSATTYTSVAVRSYGSTYTWNANHTNFSVKSTNKYNAYTLILHPSGIIAIWPITQRNHRPWPSRRPCLDTGTRTARQGRNNTLYRQVITKTVTFKYWMRYYAIVFKYNGAIYKQLPIYILVQ